MRNNVKKMFFKFSIIATILVLFCSYNVFAFSQDNNESYKKVYINQTVDVTLKEKNVIFIFCKGEFLEGNAGNSLLIGSNISIKKEVVGNFFVLFSKVQTDSYGQSNVYNLPSLYINIYVYLLMIGISLLFTAIKKKFVMQEGLYFYNKPSKIIKFGLILYFVLFSVGLTFYVSVVGYPISIIACLFLWIMLILGGSGILLLLGNKVFTVLKVKTNVYVKIIVGGIIVYIATLIPVVGFALAFLIMPVFGGGTFLASIINYKYDKIHYSQICYGEEVDISYRNYIKSIITKSK